MRRLAVPLLLSASLVALGAAWLMATPPGSAPDEGAHYVKALGAGAGDLRGRPPTISAEQARTFFRLKRKRIHAFLRESNSRAARWQARTRRQFELPRELVASTFGCTASSRDTTGACADGRQAPVVSTAVPTYVGTYQPWVYVPTGVAMRAAGEPRDALRLGRAVTLLACAALLIAALWLLWSPASPRTSLLGFALAVSPMVVFVSSVLSPSGPEVAGAICFAAALLRLTRDGEPPRGVWVALAAGGVALAGSRALGPAFAVLLLGGIVLMSGPHAAWARIRGGGRAAVAAFALIAVAAAAGAVWEFAVQPRPEPSGSSLVDAIGPSLSHLPELGLQAIGIFGAADASMPWPGYALWLLALLVLGGVALAAGLRRDRLSVFALVAGLLVVVVGMSLVYREIGRLQGRYVLPLLVLLPLWLGEVVHRRRDHVPIRAQRALAGGVLGLVALVQAVAWLANAHRFAVGESGSWSFLTGDGWSPPPGWIPWALLAAAGVASWAAAAALTAAGRDLD